MSFDDIIKSIQEEENKENEDIKNNTDKIISNIKDEYNVKIANAKNIILSKKENELIKLSEAKIFKLKRKRNNNILLKKKELLDKVYNLVLEKMNNLSDEEYINFISKIIKNLPKNLSGIIMPANGKKDLTIKILKKIGANFDISKKEINFTGGFIFYSDKFNFDNTFESIIKKTRDKTETEIAKLLFN